MRSVRCQKEETWNGGGRRTALNSLHSYFPPKKEGLDLQIQGKILLGKFGVNPIIAKRIGQAQGEKALGTERAAWGK